MWGRLCGDITVGTDRNERLRQADLDHVWHPYTQMRTYAERQPPIIEEAEGRKLKDTEGRWYWDGVSSIWLNVHGHRIDAIDEAIIQQLDEVAHSTLLGQGSVASIELAERLVDHAPDGLTRVFYQDNGSGAVEGALKMALQHWQHQGEPERTRVLSFEGGYHGETLGAIGIAPVDAFHAPFEDKLGDPLRVAYPNRAKAATPEQQATLVQEHVDALEQTLAEHAHELAACFVEPLVQGVAGIRVMPEGYLSELRRLTREHDVLLVCDEVATGFGRTGAMFACDHENITPDLMAVGKGITGGYLPLAATLVTEEVYETFLGDYEEGRHFYHGHSYTGNQLGCAAARANLTLLEELLPRLEDPIKAIRDGLAPLAEHTFVGQVRQKGFMAGIELVDAEGEPLPGEKRPGWAVAEAAREQGLLVRPVGNVLIFMPPLASTIEELDEMTGILHKAFKRAETELGELVRKAPSQQTRPRATSGSPAERSVGEDREASADHE